ncbi:hypothetical protein ACP4OV_019372 [Aristida adscensionis]
MVYGLETSRRVVAVQSQSTDQQRLPSSGHQDAGDRLLVPSFSKKVFETLPHNHLGISTVTQEDIDMWEGCGLLAEGKGRPSGAATRPEPRSGEIVVFEAWLQAGLRFPVHPLVKDVLEHYALGLINLHPNVFVRLNAFILLFETTTGRRPNLSVLRHFFSFRTSGKKTAPGNSHSSVGCIYMTLKLKKRKEYPVQPPKSQTSHLWQQYEKRWFYVKNDDYVLHDSGRVPNWVETKEATPPTLAVSDHNAVQEIISSHRKRSMRDLMEELALLNRTALETSETIGFAAALKPPRRSIEHLQDYNQVKGNVELLLRQYTVEEQAAEIDAKGSAVSGNIVAKEFRIKIPPRIPSDMKPPSDPSVEVAGAKTCKYKSKPNAARNDLPSNLAGTMATTDQVINPAGHPYGEEAHAQATTCRRNMVIRIPIPKRTLPPPGNTKSGCNTAETFLPDGGAQKRANKAKGSSLFSQNSDDRSGKEDGETLDKCSREHGQTHNDYGRQDTATPGDNGGEDGAILGESGRDDVEALYNEHQMWYSYPENLDTDLVTDEDMLMEPHHPLNAKSALGVNSTAAAYSPSRAFSQAISVLEDFRERTVEKLRVSEDAKAKAEKELEEVKQKMKVIEESAINTLNSFGDHVEGTLLRMKANLEKQNGPQKTIEGAAGRATALVQLLEYTSHQQALSFAATSVSAAISMALYHDKGVDSLNEQMNESSILFKEQLGPSLPVVSRKFVTRIDPWKKRNRPQGGAQGSRTGQG